MNEPVWLFPELVIAFHDEQLRRFGGPPGIRDVGALRLQARRIRHTDDSYAFRVSPADDPAGAGLAYSGDCGEATDLAPLIRPGDDLLVEASFGLRTVPPGAEHLNASAIVA